MFNYEPLWQTMKAKNISTYKLINEYNFDPHTLNSLKHNENAKVSTIARLCKILQCTPNEVLKIEE